MKRSLALFIYLWALVAIGLRPAAAQDSIALVSQRHNYNFAQQIQFEAKFSGPVTITGVTLLFAADDDLRIFSTDLDVPGDQSQAQVSYTLDLQQYPMRPFAQVRYWWFVQDQGGQTLETTPVAFQYADDRYPWHLAAEENIQVFWVADDPALGHTALRIAQDGLDQIQTLLPEPLSQPIAIYIYPTTDELRSALRLSGRDWIGAHADPEWGVILVSANNGTLIGSSDLQRTIPHEIAHFAINQTAGGKNNRVPTWLHEGIATLNEFRPDPTLALALEQAAEADTLLHLTSLCAGFPPDQADAVLAYAQSVSLVRFLQNHYGNHQLRELVAAYGDGADCSGGVERVLGVSLERLEANWVASLYGKQTRPSTGPAQGTSDLSIWIALLVGGSVLASALYLVRPRGDTAS